MTKPAAPPCATQNRRDFQNFVLTSEARHIKQQQRHARAMLVFGVFKLFLVVVFAYVFYGLVVIPVLQAFGA